MAKYTHQYPKNPLPPQPYYEKGLGWLIKIYNEKTGRGKKYMAREYLFGQHTSQPLD